MVKFTETKTEDLIKRIENLKAERERTADCLERLEAELERRKQEVSLGVPCDGKFYVDWRGAVQEDEEEEASKVNFNAFNSKESAEKHAEMLLDWRKSLVANSKGEPIDIAVLLPLLKKGWVAMDKNRDWFWFKEKPYIEKYYYSWNSGSPVSFIGGFNIKPVENWEESLQECGLCTC